MSIEAIRLILEAKASGQNWLDLGQCGIQGTVPQEIEVLTELEKLILSNSWQEFDSDQICDSSNSGAPNKIKSLGNGISKLRNLRIIIVAGTEDQRFELDDLKPLDQLPRLAYVDASYTGFRDLRQVKTMLQRGFTPTVGQRDTPKSSKPTIILKGCLLSPTTLKRIGIGRVSILEYVLAQKNQGTISVYESKLIFVGEREVGKSSLWQRILDPTIPLLQPHESLRKKQETQILVWKLPASKGREIRANIWDFGGDEIDYLTHHFYHTSRSIYVLVDDTRRSGKSEMETHFEKWMEVINSYGYAGDVLIFQNQVENRIIDFNEKGIRQRYGNIRGIFRGNLDDPTSADEIRMKLKKLLIDLDPLGEPWPKKWLEVRNRLEQMATEKPYVAFGSFLNIYVATTKDDDEAKAIELSEHLHGIGVITHFQDDPMLKNLLFLNSNWLSGVIQRLIRSEQVQNKFGFFDKAICNEVWTNPLEVTVSEELIRLMCKFRLCFETQILERKSWLIPSQLPVSKARIEFGPNERIRKIRVRLDPLPNVLLCYVMVDLHRFIPDLSKAWRSGVLFQKDSTALLLESPLFQQYFDVSCLGNESPYLANVVLDKITSVAEELNSKAEIEIACCCGKCKYDDKPYYFKRSYLLSKSKRTDEVECDESEEMVPINDIMKPLGVEFPKPANYLISQEEIREVTQSPIISVMESNPTKKISPKPQFGIITALPHEFAAVKLMLDSATNYNHSKTRKELKRVYITGNIPTDHGAHSVVLAMLPDMGNNIASIGATRMIEEFPSIKTILMVGIAGGVPNVANLENHVRLGDIVVSDRNGVIQYDLGKKEAIKPLAQRSPPRPPSSQFLEAFRHLAAMELVGEKPYLKHLEHIISKMKSAIRPTANMDKLHSSFEPFAEIDHPHDPNRAPAVPKVFEGKIGSANQLLKDPSVRDALRDQHGVMAIEMEGSGIADATWYDGVSYMIIRGICDYCDPSKNNKWQHYAAAAAAAYMRALLEIVPV